ncbi:HNH endonuclease family protein, partial [Rhodococcus sp. C-2]|uniref:HNH endonuclease family protein n=3 Tax=Nocardiaceae TaxID=85025 RepID=UPI0022EB5BC5
AHISRIRGRKPRMMSTALPTSYGLHLYPLSRSWRAGAANWTLEQRKSFANDTALNLIASDGPANQAKSDKGLDEWLPPNAAYRCEYAKKFLTVAAAYDLAVTTGDVAAARTACSAR